MTPSRPRSQSGQRDAEKIRAAVAHFGEQLAPRMRGDGRREDQLRAPSYTLLTTLGDILGRNVVVHDEVTLSDLRSRPDFAVDTTSGRVGYVELKAPEKGIPGNWHPSATKHDHEQWAKLRDLPNLIYTNGTLWALYRHGLLIGRVATLDGDLASARNQLAPADDELERLFREFLVWKPDRPTTLRSIVLDVAPLCRLLRSQVAETIINERTRPGKRPFTTLAAEWRGLLFPTLGDGAFADAYAQAVTFALLLARVDGIAFENRSLNDIAEQLGKQHSLMGEALSILTNPRWVRQLSVVETLRRVVGNIDWAHVNLRNSEVYATLYEKFLAEYDPKLRRQSGTYYTPDPVARSMVSFTDHVLKGRMDKTRGFAADDVVVIDPAMGTGTFLVEIIDSVVATLRAEHGSSAVPQAHLRELFANRLVGFELQAASYAVAELRLHHTLKNAYGVELPLKEVRFLSNAFDDPDALSFDLGLWYDVLKESADNANRLKRDQPVMVVIGNPPWRERARGEAVWLEKPRDRKPGSADSPQSRPSLDEFRAPLQAKRAFNLSNMWTFFWRWAIWKVFDAHEDHPAGIVTLITPKAYVTSESHAGMRRYLRETADEAWVIDLSPEGFRPDVATRLFPDVQQTICIGIFARYGPKDTKTAAVIHHTTIAGSQAQKFDQLLALHPDGLEWKECEKQWEAPFRPADQDWGSYPKLADIIPWQQTGVNSNRNWVWAPDPETLRRRWSTLICAASGDKAQLFKETSTCSLDRQCRPLPGIPAGERRLQDEDCEEPVVVRAAFRSFDRQHLIHDRRVIDRPRPELWQVRTTAQVYMSEQHAHAFFDGPALTFSALVPNVHHFNGRGGRVLPLYRDPEGSEPNVAPGLLPRLTQSIGVPVSAEDLLAYIAAVVAHPGYTRRFSEELATPGIRVPISTDSALWHEAVVIGREILWLHTYGERYIDETAGRKREAPRLPTGERPYLAEAIPSSEGHMPDAIRYDAQDETITIGDDTISGGVGRISGVSPVIWNYTVGGIQVVRKWFSYRKRSPSRKKRTSALDDINPCRWTGQFEDELFDLLNVLGRCAALEPRQAKVLDLVCDGPRISVADLEDDRILPAPHAFCSPPRRLSHDRIPGLENGPDGACG